MNTTEQPLTRSRFSMPPWVVLVVTALISALLLVMLLRDRHQQRELTTRVLSEKGASFIRAMEGALRTGVGFHWTDEELEDLLEKMGLQPDIRFVAITTEQGLVLASNDAALRHTQLVPLQDLRRLPPAPETLSVHGHERFLVLATLAVPKFQERLNAYGHRRGHGRGHGMGMGQGLGMGMGLRQGMGQGMDALQLTPEQPLLVAVAYDEAPLLEAEELDNKHLFTMAALLVLVNLAGLSAFFVLRLFERTRRQTQTEIEGLQAALRQRERLAALGNMAAGIAHEIRNPLGAIKGLAHFFKENSPVDSEEARVADIMTREALRLDRVVGDLLDLARPAALQRTAVSVSELAERLHRLLEPELEQQDVRLGVTIPPDLPPLDADSDRLTQVLLNLALNSLQAQSSTLTLTAERQGGNVLLQLTDTGNGMDDDTLERVFTPYFTTKAQGTGLGLPIVHKIMEEHGGRIHMQSRPGHGTVTTLILPAASPASEVDAS